MDRNRPLSGRRSVALATALFAITLNFLQPLAHAALVRIGAPETLWSVLCDASTADPANRDGSPPVAAHDHECCLGLAHASALAAPPTAFIPVARTAAATAPLATVERPITVGIRDGPSQPRAPPLHS